MERELNWAIAEALGWTKTRREINHWMYLGNKPFKMPRETTIYIAPDGHEEVAPPDYLMQPKLAQSLVDMLTSEEKHEWGKLYMGIGMLAKSRTSHEELVCKAWLALKRL